MNRIFKIGRRRTGIIDLYTPLTPGLDFLGYRVKWAPNFDAAFTTIINSSNVGYVDPNINLYTVESQPTTGKDVRIVFNPSSFGTPLTGVFNVTNNLATVTPTMTQVGIVYPGNTLTFGSQPGASYVVLSVASGLITLTTPYTGTTNTATTSSLSIGDSNSFWLQVAQVVGGTETLVSAPTLILPDSANRGQGIVTIHGNAPGASSSSGALQIDFPYVMQDIQIHLEDASNYLYVSTEQNGAEQELKPDTFPQYQTIWGSQPSIWVRGGTALGTGAIVAFSATFTLSFPR